MSRRFAARRVASLVAILSIAIMAAGTNPAAGATFETTRRFDSRIERPMADLQLLTPAPGSAIPRLLVIDAEPPTPGVLRMAVLTREGVWSETASATIVLRPEDVGLLRPASALAAPWMVPIDDATVSVIANGRVEASSSITRVEIVDGPAGTRPEQGATIRLPFLVDDAGTADIDGGGRPSLVVASSRTERGGSTCQGTAIHVLDPRTLEMDVILELPDLRLAGGVIGPFDAAPGDDLFAYAYPNCPAGPDLPGEARLVGLHLTDGSVFFDEAVATDAGFLGSPIRLVRPGNATDALVARRPELSLMTWDGSWATWFLAGQSSQPLAAVGALDGRPHPTVVWMDATTSHPSISTSTFDGEQVAQMSLLPNGLGVARWEQLVESVRASTAEGAPPVAFPGRILADGCPDVFVTGAIVSCDGDPIRRGAAWAATRPLAIQGEGADRRMLVAAGIDWPDDGVPRTPSPAATGVAGWWRHGPSVPFVLGEARVADTTDLRHFPVPRVIVDRTAGAAGTVDLSGPTGTRLFVRIADAEGEPADDPNEQILRDPEGQGERRVITRIAIASGLEAGRDDGFARVDLGVDVGDAGLWQVRVVPINDWGEVGYGVSELVLRDIAAPQLDVEIPFASLIWPAEAELTGFAEPGTTVRVDGGDPVHLDRQGRFVIRATLAPWPQTFRLTAVDGAGNVTTREISVIGGIDYRQIPIEATVAAFLLVAAVVSGVVGSRRPRQLDGLVHIDRTADGSWPDDGSGPDAAASLQLQDLPPDFHDPGER